MLNLPTQRAPERLRVMTGYYLHGKIPPKAGLFLSLGGPECETVVPDVSVPGLPNPGLTAQDAI